MTTVSGVRDIVTALLPSCERAFSPQQRSSPVASEAHACASPALSPTTRSSVPTTAGSALAAVEPVPS